MNTAIKIDRSATLQKQIHSLEVEGYCVLPDAIPAQALNMIRTELQRLEETILQNSSQVGDRSVKIDRTRLLIHDLQFEMLPSLHNLITNGPGRKIAAAAMLDELVCIGATFANCKPGYVGIPFHTDFDPYGSDLYRPSNPVSVRITHYLDDLTRAKAPLRLLPYSHVSMRKDRRPELRFQEELPGELVLECDAGTAVMFNPRIFHGVGPNLTEMNRRVIAITYRPRWAKPLRSVSEHDPVKLAKLSPELRLLFENINS